ncbi:MAG TPA: chromosome partitioning protein ParB [Clostridiales bacterium]|nr:chromosome partitioning protein ParB [Clostridiales bacterium]
MNAKNNQDTCSACMYFSGDDKSKYHCEGLDAYKKTYGAPNPTAQACSNFCPESTINISDFEPEEQDDTDIAKKLVYIDIDKIYPHQHNPRKELGDLTELADSIKTNGILQNLTVIPGHTLTDAEYTELCKKYKSSPTEELRCQMNTRISKDGYTVVIGHRRHAAAKLAGLDNVPCTIAEMDDKQQIATMLLENMQRNDLTLLEQAQGMQMMFDFGSTASEISEQTGFSKSTINRRIKLLELDQDKLSKSIGRGATLQDFIELDKIKDIKSKNKVLESVGTSNFNYELKKVIDQEKLEEGKTILIPVLDSFAKRVDNSNSLHWLKAIFFSEAKTFQKPDDAGKKKYCYTLSGSGSYAYLYTDREKSSAAPVVDEAAEKRKELASKLEEIVKRMFELRYDFIKSYSVAEVKKHISVIIEFTTRFMLDDNSYTSDKLLCKLLGADEDEDDALDYDKIVKESSPEVVLFLIVYAYSDNANAKCHDWYCKYEENEELSMLYNMLQKLGYQMSDEETAILNGTHELYVKVERI